MHNRFFLLLIYIILCILNNFLKTYLKIIIEGFTDGLYPSAFVNTTDEFTDGISLLAFHSSCHNHRRIYRRIYSVSISHTHRQLYWRLIPSVYNTIIDGFIPLVYFKRETFFWRAIFVCKTIGKCFFLPTDLAMKWGITNESKTDGRFSSVMSSVKKLHTKSESQTDGIFPSVKLWNLVMDLLTLIDVQKIS